jgi:hypothetical protein
MLQHVPGLAGGHRIGEEGSSGGDGCIHSGRCTRHASRLGRASVAIVQLMSSLKVVTCNLGRIRPTIKHSTVVRGGERAAPFHLTNSSLVYPTRLFKNESRCNSSMVHLTRSFMTFLM